MNQCEEILTQIKKAFVGKKDVARKILMTMLAGGHVLLEDIPGVGKTTLAVAFSNATDLQYKRIQFTPDVLPSYYGIFDLSPRNGSDGIPAWGRDLQPAVGR